MEEKIEKEKKKGMDPLTKKRVVIGIIALLLGLAIIGLVTWFANITPEKPNEIVLKDKAIIPTEICAQLNKVTVIHQAGCSACAIALPRLREIEEELNLSFDYYDLAIEEKRNEILSLNLIPQAVSTVIINCEVYVGVRSKDEYRNLITA